jgi:putative acetyltransferase
MLIRNEKEIDRATVHALNGSALETSTEANIVDTLRTETRPIISLVAEESNKIVGHILFSPVSLSGHPPFKIIGLAPMAVTPELQRQGIGSALVRAGLERCKQSGFGAVVVLGHAEYYPRFGFSPASRFGIRCEYDVPEGVFMILELEPGYWRDASGTIKFHEAFSEV